MQQCRVEIAAIIKAILESWIYNGTTVYFYTFVAD